MSGTSKIEWTDATWNPTTGCTKVSPGCKHCYAERLWPKVEGARVKREGGAPRPFTDVRCHPDRIEAPLHWREPRMVFVDSMSDLFHKDVPDEFIDQVFGVMALARQHTFQVLTKRSDRMLEYLGNQPIARRRWEDAIRKKQGGELRGVCPLPILPNVWLGVSAEDQKTFEQRYRDLMNAPAAVRFLSCEPLLGPIDLSSIDIGDAVLYPLRPWIDIEGRGRAPSPRIDWVIAGGESGPKARPPHPDWFRSLRDQCQAAGVPFFFKQWGSWVPLTMPASFHYRGALIDKLGKVPPIECLDQIAAGDPNVFAGRTHVSFVGKRRAGRLLDGIEHNEYPASPSTTNQEPK